MWVCLNDSFLSIVADRDDSQMLLVRARVAGHIEAVFPFVTVERSEDADYLFRTRLPRQVVANAIASRAFSVNYSNFKDSVPDRELHDCYLDFWTSLSALQDRRFGNGGHRVTRNLLDMFR